MKIIEKKINVVVMDPILSSCLIDLNAVSELEETVFDRLLASTVVLEWRSHHIVQDINHFEIFGQSLCKFTLAVKTFATLLQHFGVLNSIN